MDLWPLAILGLMVMMAVAVATCLWITSDQYRGAHTGVDPHPTARHRAVGLDDETREIHRDA